ncbi:unnamed protein product [Didymodactylos carnosus]|uniref:Uncharacterized protein n=1 Tax=Didymodactylos carnosus TaxID=1234261 RepID=A0A814HDU7_9BILA|nr:unnamed protein product [Didymodactylos carnosus]CAF1009492.1 unnamed protein product [Didymodactylos carnosus]CAF3668951.1 unnamed protein product [Didymodactylos carnosus]CAF3780623.1 unnamed protein product [Didymodactylos carnosus]
MWPPYFSYDWIMAHVYDNIQLPPYESIPKQNVTLGQGTTYYDWPTRAMIEIYKDYCIPVFQTDTNFTCNLLNVDSIAYIIVTDARQTKRPPCCIYQNPWNPPAPDFLQPGKGVKYNGTGIFIDDSGAERPVVWWGIADPTTPFGYSFFLDTCKFPSCVPSQFFFSAVTGFASQFFSNYSLERPPSSVFTIPPECTSAKPCDA